MLFASPILPSRPPLPEVLRGPTLGLGIALVLTVVSLPAAPASAQSPSPRAADVESADAIVTAVYDAISGAAGEARDWDRFRALFIEGAHLIPTGPAPGGGWSHQVTTVEEFVTQSGAYMEENGFFEREVYRTEERYGPVVHAFSTYESRRNADDAEPFARGINSFQLLNDGERWWVVTVFWHGETPDTPIPARYLERGGPP